MAEPAVEPEPEVDTAGAEKVPETGCVYDDLANTTGLSSSGDGCLKGQVVEDGGTCSFTKLAHVCTVGANPWFPCHACPDIAIISFLLQNEVVLGTQMYQIRRFPNLWL